MKNYFIPNPQLSKDELHYAIDIRHIKIESIITCLFIANEDCTTLDRHYVQDTLGIAYDLLQEINLLRQQSIKHLI